MPPVWLGGARPRLGLTILGAKIVVPLGPDKPSSYPATQANFVQARQYILDSLNHRLASVPSLASGSTPEAPPRRGSGASSSIHGARSLQKTCAFGARPSGARSVASVRENRARAGAEAPAKKRRNLDSDAPSNLEDSPPARQKID